MKPLKTKILIVGNKGMLGHDLMALFSKDYDVAGVDIEEMDITQPEQIEKTLNEVKPQILINSAAYTKVDDCESKLDLANLINGSAVENLVKACAARDIYFIHFSTDYIFDGMGQKPYLENDKPDPKTAYGHSKLLGEEAVRKFGKKTLIIRTAWLYGKHGPNFVDTMLKLANEVKEGKRKELRVVDDQWGSPTYSVDLAKATKHLIEKHVTGIVHMTNQGICSWYDFAVEIVKSAGFPDVPVQRIKSHEIDRPAKRPAYSVLSKDRLEKECEFQNRPWQDAVREYIKSK